MLRCCMVCSIYLCSRNSGVPEVEPYLLLTEEVEEVACLFVSESSFSLCVLVGFKHHHEGSAFRSLGRC